VTLALVEPPYYKSIKKQSKIELDILPENTNPASVDDPTAIKIALAHPAASNGVCPRQRCRLLYF